VNEHLHERARRIRERALVRSWEYRQRSYSKGLWFRLRRLLVDAGQVWVIDEADADLLESGGRVPHPVGNEMAPPKRFFIVSEEELQRFSTRRQIPVRLSTELLAARNLALVPHVPRSS
jgi:hypothetical protein